MPAQEQKTGAVIPIHWTCNQKLQITVESRISDRLGNTSEPISLAFSCTTPLPVDTRSFLIDELSLAIPTALILIVGFWLLFRKTPSERLPAIRSTLLLFCLLLVLRFVHLILHEGGHSLYAIARGIPVTLYVHPFAFAGYSRPALDNIWKDILGSLTALPLSLLISLLFWKRRSIATLLPVMLFPYVALGDGTNVTGLEGDFRNLVQTYGISPIPFVCLGVLILLVGILSFLSVFPLIGLGPKDKRALFVIPTAFFLMNALSIPVAYLFVPGSPIDREYFLGQEIMTTGVFTSLLSTIVGVILAVLYLTVFRKIYLRLPAWLRTETVHLTWKDLRLPAVLAGVSVVLGILIIT